MTYEEVRNAARGHMGPHCKVCVKCDGAACGNTIPGPGAKGTGGVFRRNVQAWEKLYLNMDTIGPMEKPDTSFQFFGSTYSLPLFAAPIGVVRNHYGQELTEPEYDRMLIRGCLDAGIAAFVGDGIKEEILQIACDAMEETGFAIPTIKPWSRELVFRKIDYAKARGAKVLAMDIDGAGLPFLKNMDPPSGPKTVEELRQIIEYAGIPFLLKGIMTPWGAEKALRAGAAGIIVSNHGGRVLDGVPATAQVLPAIADAVGNDTLLLADGGIRTGQDIFKALALGAKAVLIGRPFVTCVYGAGAEGPGALVSKLASELRDTMEMCGARSLAEISRRCLWNME